MGARLLRPPKGVRLSAIATNWASLSGLDDPTDADRERKWAFVVATYQDAMDSYLAHRLEVRLGFRPDPEEVADVRQSFLVHCVEKQTLSRADPRRGKFRAFLQNALADFAFDYGDYRLALKRRPPPGYRHVPVEDLAQAGEREPATGTPAADAAARNFDREWQQRTVRTALERLHANNDRYATVVEAMLDHEAGGPPVAHSRTLRFRAKARFQEIFRDVLKDTVLWDAFAAEEWVDLASLGDQVDADESDA